MPVEKGQAFHHPRVEARTGVARDFAHDVEPIPKPGQLAASRRRKDRDLAIFALVTELLGYGFDRMESVASESVVWYVVVEVPFSPASVRCVAYSSTDVGTVRL